MKVIPFPPRHKFLKQRATLRSQFASFLTASNILLFICVLLTAKQALGQVVISTTEFYADGLNSEPLSKFSKSELARSEITEGHAIVCK